MAIGKDRGKQKERRFSQKPKLNENTGISKFCPNREEFLNFVEIGEIYNMHP